MGIDDFFIHEKKEEFLAFVLRNQHAMMETTVDRVTATVERYAAQGWRARTTYDFSTWLGALAYENEKDARVLNIGLTMANRPAHRSITFPAFHLFANLMHEQRFRVNGKMPPIHCDFEIWREDEIAKFQEVYCDHVIAVREGPESYMRIVRLPFAAVKPEI